MSPGIVTPKEKKPIDDLKPTSLRLPQGMVQELEQVAVEAGRSRNEAIVQLLRYALDAHWKGAGRKPKK